MKPEILAPVGNDDALTAAVWSGADAVYFGAKQFNARRNAENFSDNDIEEKVNFCHYNGVKAYLTLNTLIKDAEINGALSLAQRAYNANIDGIIVQDIGLAEIIHKTMPDFPLHASTQMSVHSSAALKFLKEMGFCRVVPAREMSGKELRKFCDEAKNLGIEVEVFVHGALCMCLSGQCYFSAFLGGRSANRGLCAGTCRLPFTAQNGTGYDLSLKDISYKEHIKELTEMGVSSFKIEGRMKRAEYVAASVNCMRQAVDTGKVDEKSYDLLKRVFSRSGFTDGYFTEHYGKEMFGVRTQQDIIQSDNSYNLMHQLYRRPFARIPLKFSFYADIGNPARLTVECCEKKETVTGEICTDAINKPLLKENVTAALSKLGGTPYFADEINVEISDGLSLGVSVINEMKKAALKKADAFRTDKKRKSVELSEHTITKSTKHLKGEFLRFSSIKQIPDLDFSPFGYSVPAEQIVNAGTIDDLKIKTVDENLSPAAELLPASVDDEKTNNTLEILKNLGIKTVVCENIAQIVLSKEKGFKILTDFRLNAFNSCTVAFLEKIGIDYAVMSCELSLKELPLSAVAQKTKLLYFCYGRQPLMLTRNCPVKNGVGCRGKERGCKITDRKNTEFPVVCRNGFSEILNSLPTSLADKKDLITADLSYLYFTVETEKETAEIIKNFKQGSLLDKPYTRGLSKNGVL